MNRLSDDEVLAAFRLLDVHLGDLKLTSGAWSCSCGHCLANTKASAADRHPRHLAAVVATHVAARLASVKALVDEAERIHTAHERWNKAGADHRPCESAARVKFARHVAVVLGSDAHTGQGSL